MTDITEQIVTTLRYPIKWDKGVAIEWAMDRDQAIVHAAAILADLDGAGALITDEQRAEIAQARRLRSAAWTLKQIVPGFWWINPPNQATADVMQGIKAICDIAGLSEPEPKPTHQFVPYAANPGICSICGAVRPMPCYEIAGPA